MRIKILICLACAATFLGLSTHAAAQGRLSDNDLQKFMSNMKEDSKNFAEPFKKDLSKSTIRKTSAEKTAKQLANQFPKQVEGMLNQFKSKKNVDTTLPTVYSSYKRLDDYMSKVSPSPKTVDSWSKVKQEMDNITKAFNFTPPA